MKRKIKLIILCIVLSISALPMATFAASNTCDHLFAGGINPATTKKDGSLYRLCVKCDKYEEYATVAKADKFTLSDDTFTYNGKAKKPKVTISNSKGKYLYGDERMKPKYISSETIQVTYSNNTNVGTATMKVKIKSSYYKGTKTLHFTIKPRTPAVSSIDPLTKGFEIKWKTRAEATGYKIQYSTTKDFKSNRKTVVIKSNSTLNKNITNLESKKTYYVRMKTYTIVDGKKYYSKWSKAKTVKTLR